MPSIVVQQLTVESMGRIDGQFGCGVDHVFSVTHRMFVYYLRVELAVASGS